MKFKSTQELLEFFNNLDLDKSTLVFREGEDKDCACAGKGPCQCATPKPQTEAEEVVVTFDPATDIVVESLTDSPQFPLEFGEENKFYVKDYRTVPNACGTGRVTLENREMFINMCEMDGVAKIDMSVSIGEQKLNNISFVLEKTDGPTRVILEKSYLKSNNDNNDT